MTWAIFEKWRPSDKQHLSHDKPTFKSFPTKEDAEACAAEMKPTEVGGYFIVVQEKK